jgi:hypothetical protein
MSTLPSGLEVRMFCAKRMIEPPRHRLPFEPPKSGTKPGVSDVRK